ncbi:nitroreductase family deazaflavin-dependent oxidoreductase [Streptacidiphilus sp. NEAU-YB345]|uniref:Nitroreductase family deazaflavin-dependent oxidoreductase n=2 Tax=Streptacidiphilus fuscans TaxID=2789292 RepID=A0A931FGV6_9ACTN|nr:nitroreductase family deazaflavin-dependent oxidoreductase [Streptacidiphilus fuscans]MBF9069994.1 nitroreductase family deazaflavin-dependent oxidoreductase [Streptacidiphilus fuscans]
MSQSASTRLITPQGPVMVTLDRITRQLMIWLTKAGISVLDSRILAVRGRKSGEWRTTPVNLLTLDGTRYLVAPRGQTQWVRNMRVVGGGELRLGNKAEAFTATEVPDEEKPAILREYLRRWAWEVGYFFGDVKADSPQEEIERIAPGFPVFRITAE